MTDHPAPSMEESLAQARQRDEEQISKIHNLLKNERRRIVLRALSENGSMEKAALDRYVAAVECEKPVPNVTDAEQNRARTSLSGGHLEKLEQSGAIDWDRTEHVISLGPRSDEILEKMVGIETQEQSSVEKLISAITNRLG